MITLDAVRELRLAGRWDAALALTTLDTTDPEDHARLAVAAAEIEMDRAFFSKDASRVDDAVARARAALASTSDAGTAFELDLIELNTEYGRLLFNDPPASVVADLTSRAKSLHAAAPDPRQQAWAAFYRAVIADNLAGDHELARSMYAEVRELAETHDELLVSYALRHQAFHAIETDLAMARADADRALEIRQRLGFVPGVLAQLILLADIAAHEGDREGARNTLASVALWCRSLGLSRLTEAAEEVAGELAELS